jgi:hypothetical protein
MHKAKIENVDGVEQAVVTVNFNVGEISDESKLDDNVITVGMGVDGMERYLKQALFERKGSDQESFNNLLEEYVKLNLLKMLGVQSTPIKRNKEGVIEGFDLKKIELVEK